MNTEQYPLMYERGLKITNWFSSFLQIALILCPRIEPLI